MKAPVLIDELHVTVRVPAALPDAAARAALRILKGRPFTAAVRRAVQALLRAAPELASCSVSVTR